jgi:hypothetical protein
LSSADRALAVRAVTLTVLFRVALWIAPFRTVRAFADRRMQGPVTCPANDRWPQAVRAAVSRAGRTVPASSCLVRALVAEWLLRDGGHACRLTLGVARTGEAILEAHAWVESGGRLIAGDGPLDRYRPLVSYSTPAR